NIIYRREINAAEDPAKKRSELVSAYEEQFNNPYFPASMGFIEEIIVPRDTRKRVVRIFEAYKDKKQDRLPKKHNNIPL
ncbi:MAG: methylmalonyl-CoA carboxyltransferase, partial [Deltaproteobacteria bacterium]|nr:methylmalonyl-CoA carboxyltransferase [Deltaproteobacteria bacterium]